MEALEPNMYVRTKKGCILQILRETYSKYISRNKELCYEVDKPINVNMELYDEDILKASHNIIDLIEVGDYVNGYPVYETIEYPDNTRAIVIADDNKSIIWEESSQYIKSIVTKEQFSQMEYKVGE